MPDKDDSGFAKKFRRLEEAIVAADEPAKTGPRCLCGAPVKKQGDLCASCFEFAFVTMPARYRSRCAACHGNIPQGALMKFNGKAPPGKRSFHLDCAKEARQ